MSKIMKKYLLAFLLGLGAITVSNAATPNTKFKNLQCENLNVTGTLTNSGCSCTNTSFASTVTFAAGVASTTGTFSGVVSLSTVTVSGAEGLRMSGSVIDITAAPSASHILGISATHVLYISTSTGAGAWVKVGGQ